MGAAHLRNAHASTVNYQRLAQVFGNSADFLQVGNVRFSAMRPFRMNALLPFMQHASCINSQPSPFKFQLPCSVRSFIRRVPTGRVRSDVHIPPLPPAFPRVNGLKTRLGTPSACTSCLPTFK